ncbi:MAG: EAL domain-containing protein [Xenococcus sp. MO_188.B8]|nr:EAL domain-containing protein [Xenococcus sp. MO_188.B8]
MNNIKILIVEDELLIAKGLARQLEKSGYSVGKIVSTGKAALEYVATSLPDIILMDIAIKGKMNGIETAAKIREKNDIPIIYLTAYADEKTIEKAVDSGGYTYLLKPYKKAELNAAIKMALKKYQEQLTIQNSLQKVISQFSIEDQCIYRNNLTGLPNEILLKDLFAHLLSRADNQLSSEQNELLKTDSPELQIPELGIIYLSLDRFQKINNSLTSDRVNHLISKVVEKLTQWKNNCECELSIVQLNQSEFIILIVNVEHRHIVSHVSQTILDIFNQPFLIDEQEVLLTASIGICLYPLDGIEIDLLVDKAQKAMKFVSQQGGNQYKFYTNELNINSSQFPDNFSLENELKYAIKKEQLELVYQPKIDLKTSRISGMEALLRWNHPVLGMVPSEKFISVAEQSNLIEVIGEWALKEACRQTKIWHQKGFTWIKIAVNLSANQFNQLNLFHKLSQVLKNSGLDSQFLELELTEQILVENVKFNIQKLQLIKKLGIQIALDDFGTGYSSLSYLQQFPFNVLKIDRCFIHNIHQNPTNSIITKTIIDMAHQLNLKVVAEGVETEAELAFLVKHNCDEVQGYLFSRPLATQEFEQLLFSQKRFPIPNSALSGAKPISDSAKFS